VLLAGLVGLVIWMALDARRSDGVQARAGERVVAVGAASITVPAGWAPARAADAGVAGLRGSFAVLAPVPGLRAYAVATLTTSRLPAALEELMGPLGAAGRVELAGLPALAYGSRPVAGDRVAELTVARTAEGMLAVACVARPYSWAAVADCADQIGRFAAAPAPAA
jgi:hypothetical protein